MKYFIHISVLLLLLVISSSDALAAQAPVVGEGGFYNSIYKRVSEETDEAVVARSAESLGLSQKDLLGIIRNETLDSLDALDVLDGEFVDPDDDTSRRLLANQERALSQLDFERDLIELETALDEQVVAIEVFADGVLDDLGENFPQYDLIRDLEAIDFLIFGVTESSRLSPGGTGAFGLGGPGGLDAGGTYDEATLQAIAGASAFLDKEDDFPYFTPSEDLASQSLSFDRRLGEDDVALADPVAVDQGGARFESLECRVGKSVVLDTTPAEELSRLESGGGDDEESFVTALLGAESIGSESLNDLTALLSGVKGVSYLPEDLESVFDRPDSDLQSCFRLDFDITFCLDLELGNYTAPKVYTDENCIACHVRKMNDIFAEDLLPYSLRAHKNEGLIGAGGFCDGALEIGLGFTAPIAISKPVRNYKEICYEDPLKDQREQATRLFDTYFAQRSQLLASIQVLNEERFELLNERKDADVSRRDRIDEELVSYKQRIDDLDVELRTFSDNWLAVLEQWRALKAQFEEKGDCTPDIGSLLAQDSFEARVTSYHQNVLSTVPDTQEARTLESQIVESIVSQTDIDASEVFTRAEAEERSAQESYSDLRALQEYEERASMVADQTKHLGKEINEMTSHFQSFLDSMESLRRGDNNSVLQKLLSKDRI